MATNADVVRVVRISELLTYPVRIVSLDSFVVRGEKKFVIKGKDAEGLVYIPLHKSAAGYVRKHIDPDLPCYLVSEKREWGWGCKVVDKKEAAAIRHMKAAKPEK